MQHVRIQGSQVELLGAGRVSVHAPGRVPGLLPIHALRLTSASHHHQQSSSYHPSDVIKVTCVTSSNVNVTSSHIPSHQLGPAPTPAILTNRTSLPHLPGMSPHLLMTSGHSGHPTGPSSDTLCSICGAPGATVGIYDDWSPAFRLPLAEKVWRWCAFLGSPNWYGNNSCLCATCYALVSCVESLQLDASVLQHAAAETSTSTGLVRRFRTGLIASALSATRAMLQAAEHLSSAPAGTGAGLARGVETLNPTETTRAWFPGQRAARMDGLSTKSRRTSESRCYLRPQLTPLKRPSKRKQKTPARLPDLNSATPRHHPSTSARCPVGVDLTRSSEVTPVHIRTQGSPAISSGLRAAPTRVYGRVSGAAKRKSPSNVGKYPDVNGNFVVLGEQHTRDLTASASDSACRRTVLSAPSCLPRQHQESHVSGSFVKPEKLAAQTVESPASVLEDTAEPPEKRSCETWISAGLPPLSPGTSVSDSRLTTSLSQPICGNAPQDSVETTSRGDDRPGRTQDTMRLPQDPEPGEADVALPQCQGSGVMDCLEKTSRNGRSFNTNFFIESTATFERSLQPELRPTPEVSERNSMDTAVENELTGSEPIEPEDSAAHQSPGEHQPAVTDNNSYYRSDPSALFPCSDKNAASGNGVSADASTTSRQHTDQHADVIPVMILQIDQSSSSSTIMHSGCCLPRGAGDVATDLNNNRVDFNNNFGSESLCPGQLRQSSGDVHWMVNKNYTVVQSPEKDAVAADGSVGGHWGQGSDRQLGLDDAIGEGDAEGVRGPAGGEKQEATLAGPGMTSAGPEVRPAELEAPPPEVDIGQALVDASETLYGCGGSPDDGSVGAKRAGQGEEEDDGSEGRLYISLDELDPDGDANYITLKNVDARELDSTAVAGTEVQGSKIGESSLNGEATGNSAVLAAQIQTNWTKLAKSSVPSSWGKVPKNPRFRIKEQDKPLKCDSCGRRFVLKKMLDNHKCGITYPCPTCGKEFKKKCQLQAHSFIHKHVKDFVCNICGNGFKEKSNFNRHVRTHSSLRPYKCPHCSKCFKVAATLYVHRLTHDARGRFVCDICGKDFKRPEHLRQHRRIHTGERPYRCTVCDQCFTTDNTLRTHMRRHTGERPYPCPVCKKRFTQSSAMKTHWRRHSAVRVFSCSVCQTSFKQRLDLNRHMLSHSSERPFQCPDCPQVFKTRSNLLKHGDTHAAGNQVTCETCGKHFRRLSYLRLHEATHRGGKRFHCQQCGKSFTRKYNLRLHQEQHQEGGRRCHTCPRCRRNFRRLDGLRAHMESVHGERMSVDSGNQNQDAVGILQDVGQPANPSGDIRDVIKCEEVIIKREEEEEEELVVD